MPLKFRKDRGPLLTTQDKLNIAAEVARECGRMIPSDDPLFDLVVVNENLLRRTVEKLCGVVTGHLVGSLERTLTAHVDHVDKELSRAVESKVRDLVELHDLIEAKLDRRVQLWLIGIGVFLIFTMALSQGLIRWPL